MANCNECKNLGSVVENTEDGKYINQVCTKHKVSVRYTAVKKFNGYIWPCSECDGNQFKKK